MGERSTDFSMVRYKKVDIFYQYDAFPLLTYKGNYYVHKDSSVYKSSELRYFGSFHPEGILDYSKHDLSKDSLFVDHLGLKLHKEIQLQNDTLMPIRNIIGDNAKSFRKVFSYFLQSCKISISKT
jgi:hypothetical protein